MIQGFGFELAWQELNEAAIAINRGAHWVATNDDPTRPTDRGLVPGNGAAVAAVQLAVRVRPEVAGKPYRPLLDDTVRRVGARRPVFVGDRLDTDIAGRRRTPGWTACWCSAARTARATCWRRRPARGPRTWAPTCARCCGPARVDPRPTATAAPSAAVRGRGRRPDRHRRGSRRRPARRALGRGPAGLAGRGRGRGRWTSTPSWPSSADGPAGLSLSGARRMVTGPEAVEGSTTRPPWTISASPAATSRRAARRTGSSWSRHAVRVDARATSTSPTPRGAVASRDRSRSSSRAVVVADAAGPAGGAAASAPGPSRAPTSCAR